MAVIEAPICPLHEAPARLVDASVVYGRPLGWLWKCDHDGCDYYVGAHSDGRPKGTMANAPIRLARQRAHDAFDGWWRRHGLKRGAAYKHLAQTLGVSEAHIAHLDVEGCQRVIAAYRGKVGC